MNEVCLDAKHVVHMSLNEGLDVFWPFGKSILENIYKVFKQKELLEDSILIYRVSRAPERRIFKIDVGNMPSHLAMQFVERIKNEMHQRRIPTTTGGAGGSDIAGTITIGGGGGSFGSSNGGDAPFANTGSGGGGSYNGGTAGLGSSGLVMIRYVIG